MIVVRHSYISARQKQSWGKGKSARVAAVGRALAHLKYIQHRPGEDREQGGREMFTEDEEKIDPKALRKAIKELGAGKVVVHKLTLSPEVDPTDKKAFTREVMDQLAREKGLDLQWVAVEHNNTDHGHIHVVVLGKDKKGKEVRIDKKDYPKMKEYGDRYLERCHPLEMERAREQRERKEKERLDAYKKERESERQERIKEGLELPFIHKKIIREMYEPYEQWRKQQDEKERLQAEKELQKTSAGGQENPSGAEPEKPFFQDTIKAAGKEWSKLNTLAELQDLNEYLWDNYDERLAIAEYKKLVAWMHEKEELGERSREQAIEPKEPDKLETIELAGKTWSKENTLAELKELGQSVWKDRNSQKMSKDDYEKLVEWIEEKEQFGDKPPTKPKEKEPQIPGKTGETKDQHTPPAEKEKKDYFEYQGQKYSKDSEYEKLTALAQKLRENKKERLPVQEYQQLRGWIENADRARWSGVLEKQMELSKTQDWQAKARTGNPNNYRYIDPVQQELMANPVVGIYLQGASVAAQLVKWVTLDDRGRDFNKEAIDQLEETKKDIHNRALNKGKTGSGGAEQDEINKLNEAIDQKLDERNEEKRKKREKPKRDPFKYDPWGEY